MEYFSFPFVVLAISGQAYELDVQRLVYIVLRKYT